MSDHIDFYFDFISPFGYLAAGPVEALGAEFDRPVRWHPILLGVTVMQVMGLKPLMETPLKADYMLIDRPRMAKRLEGLKARLLGATVAVKQATSRKKTSGEALLREIRYLRMAGPHPNLVQAYGAFVEAGRLNLVMEFARHSLRQDRVARSADPVLVLAGVARALVRLHSLSIVHRDLKARNVLVAADNRALLIDFGLACHVYHDSAEWVGRTVEWLCATQQPSGLRRPISAAPPPISSPSSGH